MGSRWPSARHCYLALRRLLDQLSNHFSEGLSNSNPGLSGTRSDGLVNTESQAGDMLQESGPVQNQARGTKRKLNEEMGNRREEQFQSINANPQIGTGTLPFPVLEYTGPDFGFDATQLSDLGPAQNFVSDPNSDMGGFYGNVGWDAFIQGLGYDGRFNI